MAIGMMRRKGRMVAQTDDTPNYITSDRRTLAADDKTLSLIRSWERPSKGVEEDSDYWPTPLSVGVVEDRLLSEGYTGTLT